MHSPWDVFTRYKCNSTNVILLPSQITFNKDGKDITMAKIITPLDAKKLKTGHES
jgi:hypothetical protein